MTALSFHISSDSKLWLLRLCINTIALKPKSNNMVGNTIKLPSSSSAPSARKTLEQETINTSGEHPPGLKARGDTHMQTPLMPNTQKETFPNLRGFLTY